MNLSVAAETAPSKNHTFFLDRDDVAFALAAGLTGAFFFTLEEEAAAFFTTFFADTPRTLCSFSPSTKYATRIWRCIYSGEIVRLA